MYVVIGDGGYIMSEEPIKDIDFSEDDIKKKKKRRKPLCPYCGNELNTKIIKEYAFCSKCHRRMPWTVREMEDTPVKQEN